MRVSNLKIENFRGIRSGWLTFSEHAVLIGSNNAGKTTVIEALALLLGRDRMVRELTEHDFFGSEPMPADRILLVATLCDFPGNDPARNMDWFREGRGVPKWLDLATGDVRSLPDAQCQTLCCQIAFQAHFDRESLSVETTRYFHDHDHPIDPFADDVVVGVPPKLIQHVGFYLVRASRTWDKVLSWGSELFRRTIQAAAAQPSAAIIAERDRLRRPESPIEQDAQLRPLIENVNAEMARYLNNPPELQLRVTSTDSRSVMDSVAAHFSVAAGIGVPSARQGSGLVSLQSLFLLLEMGRVRLEGGEGFLLALEEPEIHLPQPSQQQLVRRVQALASQTIITTHSSAIAAAVEPTSIQVLRNDLGVLSSSKFLVAPIGNDAPNWMRKTFQQRRVDVISALLHSNVLVPEGLSEFHLLQTLVRPLLLNNGHENDRRLGFGIEVGVIPTEDAKVLETFRLLERVHAQVSCLVDGDAEGRGYALALLAEPRPPFCIIRWSEGWTIEDVVGWMFGADEEGTIAPLQEQLPHRVENLGELVQQLRANKANVQFYESIADVLTNNVLCTARAMDLLDGLSLACSGVESQHFRREPGNVFVFRQ